MDQSMGIIIILAFLVIAAMTLIVRRSRNSARAGGAATRSESVFRPSYALGDAAPARAKHAVDIIMGDLAAINNITTTFFVMPANTENIMHIDPIMHRISTVLDRTRDKISGSSPTYANYHALYYGFCGSGLRPTADGFESAGRQIRKEIGGRLINLADLLRKLDSDFHRLGCELGVE